MSAYADRRLVAQACRVLAHRGLAEDVLGHVSARVSADRLIVRCRGPQEHGLLFTTPDDVHELSLGDDGAAVDLGQWAAPNELPIHTVLMEMRPEVDAVVHCHPPAVLVAGIAGLPLRPVFGAYNIPAARLAIAGVPVYPRSVLVRRRELAQDLVAAMGDAPVCVLRGHGIVTTGSGPYAVQQAVVRALNLDTLARTAVALASLDPAAGAGVQDIAPADVDELPDLGGHFNDLTVWRHAVARLEHDGYGRTS
jgi:ribulose-5-phosphate 4-epimerase/fuculose-1-phosphate aldolase